jgi:ribosome-associated protein
MRSSLEEGFCDAAIHYLCLFNFGTTKMTPATLKKIIIDTLEEHKATEVITIDVRKKTDITDYFVICTANSARHIKALADHLVETVKKKGITPVSHEGWDNNSNWALLDFGSTIVHIMSTEAREFYSLEKLWQQTPQKRGRPKKISTLD